MLNLETRLLEMLAVVLAIGIATSVMVTQVDLTAAKARLPEALIFAHLELGDCHIDTQFGKTCATKDLDTPRFTFAYSDDRSKLLVSPTSSDKVINYFFEPTSDSGRYMRLRCQSNETQLVLNSCK